MISFQLQSGFISVCQKNKKNKEHFSGPESNWQQIKLYHYKLFSVSPKICEANSILSDLLSFDLSCWRAPLFFSPSDWFPSSSQSGQQRESLSRGDADGEAPALIVRGSWRSSCPWQPQRCRGHGRLWPAETQKQLFVVQNGQSGRCPQSFCFFKCNFNDVCINAGTVSDDPWTTKKEHNKCDDTFWHTEK